MYLQGEVNRQPNVGLIEVQAGDLGETVHAIEQGMAVDAEQFRRLGMVAMTLEESFQCEQQFGALPFLGIDQMADGAIAQRTKVVPGGRMGHERMDTQS